MKSDGEIAAPPAEQPAVSDSNKKNSTEETSGQTTGETPTTPNMPPPDSCLSNETITA